MPARLVAGGDGAWMQIDVPRLVQEQTNYPREIAELALAHVLADKSEAAYSRGDALDKRRQLMAAWARYCGGKPAATGATVTPMRKLADA